jgi:hypothetical protein
MHPFAIARYLLVPLNASSLLSILYFAGALTLAEHAGVVGIPLFLGIGWLFFCYGFALLDHVLEGRSSTLVLSTDVIGAFATRSLGTLLLVALLYYLTDRLQQWIHPTVIVVLRLFLLALLPAAIGGMIMTGRFLAALNPVAMIGTISRIPTGYVALWVVLVAIWAVPLWIFHDSAFSFSSLWRAESFLPLGMVEVVGFRGVLIGLLGHIVAVYLWLATFACIGGALYEWRWDLDIKPAEAPEREAEREEAELERDRDRLMDRLYGELRVGPFSRAAGSAQKLIEEAAQPLDECRWLYARSAKIADQRLADHLAQILLPLLLKHRATGEALDVTRQRLKASPGFRPRTSSELFRLVELACVAGERATAWQLLGDFESHYGSALPERLAQLRRDLATAPQVAAEHGSHGKSHREQEPH